MLRVIVLGSFDYLFGLYFVFVIFIQDSSYHSNGIGVMFFETLLGRLSACHAKKSSKIVSRKLSSERERASMMHACMAALELEEGKTPREH